MPQQHLSAQVSDEEPMLQMSIGGHLEDLRTRIIRALAGIGIAFLISAALSTQIWMLIEAPLRAAVEAAGGEIILISPTEALTITWIYTPLLAAVYLATPWVLFQFWAFIAPGLYRRERRWVSQFAWASGGLFLAGGAFAYLVALRYSMTFLLGIGLSADLKPMISVKEYFPIFVNTLIGVSVLFELPVAVYFLTLLHLATPSLLLKNARYAVLGIVTLAAIITPTQDPVTLAIFSAPMIVLFFLGVFASYLLVLKREGQRFPWKRFSIGLAIILALLVMSMGIAELISRSW